MSHAPLSRRARLRVAGIGAATLLLAGTSLIASSVAFAATANCNGVFDGQTPEAPIKKSADVSTAHPGDTVTYTISWHSTGVDAADVTDCFRVGDGSDSTLNAIVTGFNVENDVTNQGDQGSLQTLTYQITVPNDPALLGKDIVDRAKITHGSVESRSDLIPVHITPAPCEENCSSPSPTPSVTVSATSTPTVSATSTAPTKVKGVTLGKTGSNDSSLLWLGIVLIVAGLGLTGSTLRRRSLQR
jgi:LPXTG-motif cell wall-anchored protein